MKEKFPYPFVYYTIKQKKSCMKKRYVFATIFLLATIFNVNGQTVKVPLTLDKWDTITQEREDATHVTVTREVYKGKECFRVESGSIILKDVDLRDGIIEADVSFPQERGFPGFSVRMQDLSNFENFYMRPHQSGNPDATQYTPDFNGQTGFQLYAGPGYWGAVTYKFNEWQHVKIDLHGLQAEFYIDDIPIIKVKELLHGWKPGKIAIGTGGVPLRIANVQYSIKQVPAPTPLPIPANGDSGVVTRWQISNLVHRNLFDNTYWLTPEIKKQLSWSTQTSDFSGLINLARLGGVPTDKGRTMVAKLMIESTKDQVKGVAYGFSDYVKVYLNDDLLYYGDDRQYTRDYRYLGTVGLFDKLFLHLHKGMNELWFVVIEDFGGWGLRTKFDDMENISLK